MNHIPEVAIGQGVEILKADQRGRVRMPQAKQEALLRQYDQSGMSAAAFARCVGVKYPTFAGWLQRRRQRTAQSQRGGIGEVRWLEAEVATERAGGESAGKAVVVAHLPGGVRVEGQSPAVGELLISLGVVRC